MYGKQALASHTANNAVHLYDSRFWMFPQELLEVNVAPPNTASSVNLEFSFFITGTIFHFAGQVNVPDIKQLGVHIVIQGFLTAHQLIYMIQIDLMKRLSVFDQRADDLIDSGYIIFIGKNAGSGLGDCKVCPLMCVCRIIDTLKQGTFGKLFASITNVRRLIFDITNVF